MLQWTQKEHENRSEEMKRQLDREMNPQRHWLHRIFLLIRSLTMVSAFNMGLGQLIGMFYEVVSPTQYVLRVYVILLCSLTLLNELEWTNYTKDSTLLKLWITRGLFYAFVGVLGLEENAVSPTRDGMVGSSPVLMYIKVVAWLMVACGCVYTVMGCACFQLVEDRLRNDFEQRKQRAKTMARVTTTMMGGVAADIVTV